MRRFAEAAAALEHLERHASDVVVAGDGLGQTTCAALLCQVPYRHPEVVRVVLT